MAQTEQLVVSISEKGALVVKRNVEGIGKGARKAEGSVKLLQRALGGFAALGVAAGVTVAIKQLASFSQEMSTVKAITNATAAEFALLEAKAKDLGTNTRFSATQAGEGMTFLARAGFTTQQVLATIGPTLQLAQAGALSLASAADIASNVLTGFGIAAENSQRVIDVLALAANSANTDVTQLGEAMSYVAPVARMLNVPLEETAAAVQVMSDAGIQASRAGTNLTMVMRLMENPTRKQLAVLKKLNLEQSDLSVVQHGLTGALKNFKDSGADAGDVLAYFGRSAAGASVLLEGTTEKIQRYTAANEAADGTAARIAKTMDDNLNGALLSVKSAWEGVILAMGDMGAETGLTKFFKGLASTLRFVASHMEKLGKAVLVAGFALATVFYAKGLVAAAKGLDLVKLKATQLFALMSANPFTAWVVGISAAIALMTIFSDEIKIGETGLVSLADVATVAGNQLEQLFAKASGGASDTTRNTLSMGQTVGNFLFSIVRAILTMLDKVVGTVTGVVAAIVTIFMNGFTLIKGAFTGLANLLIKILGTSMNGFIKIYNLAATKLGKTPLPEMDLDLVLLENDAARKSKIVGETIGNQLMDGIKSNVGTEWLDGLLDEAEGIAAAREAESAKKEAAGVPGVPAVVEPTATTPAVADMGFQELFDGLRTEAELLKVSSREREIRQGLIAAEAQLQRPLTEAEQLLITAELERNQILGEQAALLESIKGPQLEYENSMSRLNELLNAGAISEEEYTNKAKEMKDALDGVAATNDATGDSLSSVWMNASGAIDEFVDTGIFKFKDFARSVVSDISKILIKLMMLKAIEAGLGMKLPGFATGGSFLVGGSGGTDSQTVAFQATPGERVDISTPGQQRAAAGQAAQAQGGGGGVTIINVVDPNEVLDIMGSEEGTEVVLNTISRNQPAVKQALA